MMRCENMQELKPIKEGKVREIYDNGDSLIMVCLLYTSDAADEL